MNQIINVMKKVFALSMLLCTGLLAWAQEDMPIVWEKKMDHRILYSGTGLEDEISYTASDKEITAFKNSDGSVVWTSKFKDLAPKLGKIDELIPFWESDVIFLFDRKMGKDQIACVDLNTGALLWTSDK